jgi:hypothetical protein
VTSASNDICGVYVGDAGNAPDVSVKAEGAPACY